MGYINKEDRRQETEFRSQNIKPGDRRQKIGGKRQSSVNGEYKIAIEFSLHLLTLFGYPIRLSYNVISGFLAPQVGARNDRLL